MQSVAAGVANTFQDNSLLASTVRTAPSKCPRMRKKYRIANTACVRTWGLRTAQLGFALGLLGCTAEEAKKADSTQVIYEEDINARDTTPTPPPSPIGRMRLSGTLPEGGECKVTRYPRGFEMAYQVVYEAFTPPRKALMEVGHPPRQFPPVNLQITGSQSTVTLREQETIFAGFSPQGSVTVGTRTYSSEGAVSANDRSPLSLADSAEMVQIAQRLLTTCPPGR